MTTNGMNTSLQVPGVENMFSLLIHDPGAELKHNELEEWEAAWDLVIMRPPAL